MSENKESQATLYFMNELRNSLSNKTRQESRTSNGSSGRSDTFIEPFTEGLLPDEMNEETPAPTPKNMRKMSSTRVSRIFASQQLAHPGKQIGLANSSNDRVSIMKTVDFDTIE